MQKSLVLLLLGCAVYTNAIETSLRHKLKTLAQLEGANHNKTQPNLSLPDCDLDAPDLGDLSGDLLDWCPHEFGADRTRLEGALTRSQQSAVSLSQS